jgi:FMN-dependent NADH-azoreductase
MSSILVVTSSPRGAASHSTRIANEFAQRLLAANPANTLVARDVAANPLPHIDTHFSFGIYTPEEGRTPEQQSVVAVSDALVDELFAADTIIIAVGMVNFNIPSSLKAWLDNIFRAGKTFSYGAEGPKGLVTGKKVYVVLASGGVYSDGPGAFMDHATPYLRNGLAFLGMTDVEFIRIEGVAMGPDAEAKAIAAALDQTSDIALAA